MRKDPVRCRPNQGAGTSDVSLLLFQIFPYNENKSEKKKTVQINVNIRFELSNTMFIRTDDIFREGLVKFIVKNYKINVSYFAMGNLLIIYQSEKLSRRIFIK